jgi:hypothetical protein
MYKKPSATGTWNPRRQLGRSATSGETKSNLLTPCQIDRCLPGKTPFDAVTFPARNGLVTVVARLFLSK